MQRTLRRLHFAGGFDERSAEEANMRGYRSHVWAELDDGSRYQVTYFDMVRLKQELEYECSIGSRYFTEPGLIIVSEVTLANMESAARALAEEGFFERYIARAPQVGDEESETTLADNHKGDDR